MNHYIAYDSRSYDGAFIYGPFLPDDALKVCKAMAKETSSAKVSVFQYVAGEVEACYPFGLEEYGPFVGTYPED